MNPSSLRFKNIESTIINILNDHYEKCLKVQLSKKPDNISSLINYLKQNGWCNYKFNGYSMKNHVNEQDVVVILNYIPPTLNFS